MRRESAFSVLLIEKEVDLAGAISFALHSQFGATVFECPDRASAENFLSHVSNLSLVILSPEDVGAEGPTTSCILRVDGSISDPSLLFSPSVIGVARAQTMIDDVLDLVKKKFFPGEVVDGLLESDFCQISPRLLLKVFPLAADVYIRISDRKHLKIFAKGGQFESSDFEKYAVKKGLQYLYVRRSDSRALLAKLAAEVQTMIEREPPDSDALQDLASDIQESIHDMISNVGMTDEVREMAKANMDLVLRLAKSNPNIEEILAGLQSRKESYITQHSLALAQLACAFASRVGWTSDVTFQKLILAALFHDITLQNSEMAKVRNLKDLSTGKEWVFFEKIEDLNDHPRRAAEIVGQLGGVLPDVDVIIRHHQERPDGSGFPEGITYSKFTPLSALFVVAEDFLDFNNSLNPELRADAMKQFLSHREKEYANGPFKQIFKELSSHAG